MAAQEGAVEAMFTAAEEDDVEGVKRLLDQDSGLLEARDRWGRTPLISAAFQATGRCVRLLVDRGADVDARDTDGETALYIAAREGHQEVVAFLLDRGAAAITYNDEGQTPLSAASEDGHLDVVRLLLRHLGGAGLDGADIAGRTALWWACGAGHTETAQALLLAGADHTIASGVTPTPVKDYNIDNAADEMTPLEVAQMRAHESTVTLLKRWEGELDRGYVVHRARSHLEQHSILQPWLAAMAACTAGRPPVATHLRPRLTIPQFPQIPQVEIVPVAEEKMEAASTSKRKAAEQGEGEGPCEGEKETTLQYVMHDLTPELYIELMAGFH